MGTRKTLAPPSALTWLVSTLKRAWRNDNGRVRREEQRVEKTEAVSQNRMVIRPFLECPMQLAAETRLLCLGLAGFSLSAAKRIWIKFAWKISWH